MRGRVMIAVRGRERGEVKTEGGGGTWPGERDALRVGGPGNGYLYVSNATNILRMHKHATEVESVYFQPHKQKREIWTVYLSWPGSNGISVGSGYSGKKMMEMCGVTGAIISRE
ncbi:hypothetical protein PoB_005365900 [Plakobranchus ocellatus]|uniref:Uncharacterized protein n=1 Tax=Plakobranchus ocellatus TaxID=259542 RepID=A0AAV4C3M5_9GAST|nr:hypothetical protein PoB_005365900 [Plakobranchus ocellatus]